jgi:PAS domain S-box-containing protein
MDEFLPPANVLLVDDHPSNLLALRAVLEPLGQNLVEASSGAEALRLLQEDDYAVILLDVQMPDMDGLETAILIKQSERARHVPILLLTARHKDGLDVFKAYSIGAVDYLIKPLDPGMLRSKVAVFIELHRKTLRNRREADLLREKRKRDIEDLVRANDQRYRTLADAMPQIVWTASSAGTVLYRNRRWYECAGADESATSLGWEAVLHPDDLQRFTRQWEAARERGFDWSGEFRFGNRKTGLHRWHLVRAVPATDAQGTRAWVGTSTDIHDQKRTEDALIAASRAKDEFLAVLSHELRTPLNAVLGWTTILREKHVDEIARARALETIERNARAQAQLIADLLDVSRIVSGKLAFDLAPTTLLEVVSDALEAAHPGATAAGIRIEADCQLLGEQANADADRLRQVVGNLLSNAIKFTPAGGAVRVTLDRHADHARLVVADEGCGIEPERLPHVFERFWQGGEPTTRERGGLGLGLAIAKHIVEVHGGTVTAESAGAGRGARFTVMIPLLASQSLGGRRSRERLVGHATTTMAPLRGVNVLVVEDDDDGRELLEVVLRDQGAIVEAVSTADDALRALRDGSFDILLSDIGLPHQDGYALLARARRTVGINIPAIALTAYASRDDRARTAAAGFDSHIAKPIDPGLLIDTIGSLVRPRVERSA